MAISGVFITWGFASEGLNSLQGQATLLAGSGQTSEAMATTAVSATSAPLNASGAAQPTLVGAPILSIAASAPIFYTVGPSASPPTSPPTTGQASARYYDPSTGPLDIVCKGGDKMAWILA